MRTLNALGIILSDDDEDDDDEDDEDEDDTAELLRELEKIKRERAEEKERQEREQSATSAAQREMEIATANPLLNLAAALGQTPGINTTAPGTFTVKRRWDDGTPLHYIRESQPDLSPYVDLIFKNQAMNSRDKDKASGQFVNDLLRTEFHKYVSAASRLIKTFLNMPVPGNSWQSSLRCVAGDAFPRTC